MFQFFASDKLRFCEMNFSQEFQAFHTEFSKWDVLHFIFPSANVVRARRKLNESVIETIRNPRKDNNHTSHVSQDVKRELQREKRREERSERCKRIG